MRFLTTLVIGICVSCMVLAQDPAKKPEATKEIAKSVWDKLNAGPSAVFESNKIILMLHLLVKKNGAAEPSKFLTPSLTTWA